VGLTSDASDALDEGYLIAVLGLGEERRMGLKGKTGIKAFIATGALLGE